MTFPFIFSRRFCFVLLFCFVSSSKCNVRNINFFQLENRLRRVICSPPISVSFSRLKYTTPLVILLTSLFISKMSSRATNNSEGNPAISFPSVMWTCLTYLLSRGTCNLFLTLESFVMSSAPSRELWAHHTALDIGNVSPWALGPRFLHVSNFTSPELETTVFYYSRGLFLTLGRSSRVLRNVPL